VLRIINEPTAAALAYGRDLPTRSASRSTTSAAAPSTSRSSSWPTACSGCARPPATPSSAARTSTTPSSTGSWPSSRANNGGHDLRGDRLALQRLKEAAERGQDRAVERVRHRHQPAVPRVEVHQGGHEQASKNRRLGRFVLGDLRPAPRGVTRVEVSFTMDADGILHVDAVEVATGKATSVKIEAGSGLSGDEIKRLAAGMR
jgi:molecular chaperone DnaK (HSP70)